MIAYSCPKCRAFLTAHDADAGKKLACVSCGQRLQVPALAPANRTVLGKLEEFDTASRVESVSPAHALGSRPASVRASSPAATPGTVTVSCPGCGRAIALQPGELSLTVQCAGCDHYFVPVPSAQPSRQADAEIERVKRDEPVRHWPRCPYCRYDGKPFVRQRVAVAGWIVMGIIAFICLFLSLFLCFPVLLTPLCLLGLLVKEHYRVCGECGMTLP